MKISTLVLATMVVSSSFVTAASDARADEVAQRVVSFGDLDLNGQDAVATLYSRIRNAARKVCGYIGPQPVEFTVYTRRCIDLTTEKAVGDVNSSSLSAYAISLEGMPDEVEMETTARIHHANSVVEGEQRK